MNKKTKFVDAAQKHLQKGAYDKAIKELQKLLEEDPRDVRTLLKIGDIYAKKGDGPEATKTYRRVAEAYSEQGFFLKAVAVYKQILKHEPHNLEVTLKLAELYEHLGVMQEAMVQYQIVAGILDSKGSTREWLGVLQRMVDLEPENVASHVRYAEGLSREHRTEEAIAQFVVACDLLERQGRTDDWAKVAERLVFLAPARYDVLKRLAKQYLAAGDLRRAIARLEPCFRGLPRDVETLTLLGRAFREAEHTNKAIYILKELARVHQDEGRAIDARRTYQQILELDPSDAETAAVLGTSPQPSGRPQSSIGPSGSTGDETARPRAAGSAPPPRVPSTVRPHHPRRRTSSLHSPVPSGPPRASKETAKLLSEADVYVKYGLREKALEHLRMIVGQDPEALEAYAKMRDLYAALADRPRSADALASMVSIHKRRGEDATAERLRAELAALVPGHPLARPGDHDLDFASAAEVSEDDDSFDIDVTDDSGDDPFDLGPAPTTLGRDTADLRLDDGEDPASSAESLGELDILDIHPRSESGAIPVVRGEALSEDEGGGFGRVGTDIDARGVPISQDLQVDADSLFEGERSPVSVDLPLSADAVTGAIELASRDEPLERASQLPAAPDRSSTAPGDAELLSLLEGGDDLGDGNDDDELDDPALAEDLENVEFLLAQGLHDDAREAVLDILKRHPLHPRAIGALDRAEVALGLRTSEPRSSVEPVPDVPGAQTEQVPVIGDGGEDESFGDLELADLGAALASPPHGRTGRGGLSTGDLGVSSPDDRAPADLGLAALDLAEAGPSGFDPAALELTGLDEAAHPAAGFGPAGFDAGGLDARAERGFGDASQELFGGAPPEAFGGASPPAFDGELTPARESHENGSINGFAHADPHPSVEDPDAVALADTALTQGYELQQQGHYAEAIAAYDAATRVPSRAAQAYEMLGICLQSQGDTMGAVTAFYRALEMGAPPERAPRLKYEIGIACETASDLENALAWYLAAYADDPTQPHLRARIENLGTDPDAALLSATPAPSAASDALRALSPAEVAPAPVEPPPPSRRRNKISYI